MRKNESERLKLKWFKKPIIGHGSNSDQPMDLTENEAGTLIQEETGSQKSNKSCNKNPKKHFK